MDTRHGISARGAERSPASQGWSTGSTAPRHVAPKHAAAPSPGTRRWSWDVLAYRDFRLYFAGTVISNLGTWLQNTAQALLAYQLTHSVLAIGAVVCAQFSWVLLLGPWTGTIVSRARSVPRLLIIAQLSAAAAAAAIAALQFAGLLTEDWLIAGALGLGLAYCLTLPAASVLVPALIPARESGIKPQSEIRAAMALDSASYNIGRCAAPLLAVLVVTCIGFGWAFALNAASFLALAAALAKVSPCAGSRPEQPSEDHRRFPCRSAVTRRLQLLLAIVAAVTIAADPVLVLGPALARHFGLPEIWAGYFLSALGGGTIVGFVRAHATTLAGATCGIPALPPWSGRHCVRARPQPMAVAGRSTCGGELLACSRDPLPELCCGPSSQRSEGRPAVMAIWAVAWAGSKPLASLVDGMLATFIGVWTAGMLTLKLPNVQTTGVLLALPALLLGLAATPRLLRLV